jgi:hypothetical protein
MSRRDPRPSVRALLADPAVRHPLKAVLRAWADRDPIDAAEDANLLALALERKAHEAPRLSVSTAAHRGEAMKGGRDGRPLE